ncbi:MAG: DNA recombination protein RmuC [Spirochaetes bacterium]|jgi:DNA recombination protein RmuC|nr:DNA recombination protein RmuC [Spirochaetota bacterium]
MTVTFIEIIISSFSLLTIGVIVGYFLSRKVINKNVATIDDLNSAKQTTASLQAQLDEKNKYIEKIDGEITAERDSVKLLNADLASRDQKIINLKELMEKNKTEIEQLNSKFNEEFKNIANQVLLSNSGEFNRQTAEKLRDVLSPFKDQIEKFEKKIDDSRTKQIEESTSLKSQINQLSTLNVTLSDEARNLTNALKNESKTRGNWGEMILEKILESSGLIKNEHYTVQTSLKDEENNRLQPDVIIHLPENKHIIIDSKVSLVAYEKCCNAEEGAERDDYLKRHIDSIYTHVNNLSSKEYQKALGVNPPDFILMFIPIEPALVIALERDRDLFGHAWKKNIAIISPTTLIPTLKIIHNIWRQESQNKNALTIAVTGGKLYDKLHNFTEDLIQIGRCIDTAKGNYNEALKKLSSGRGNAISLAEKMKEMGAKASKQLPLDVLPDEDGE